MNHLLNVHWQPYHRDGKKDPEWFAELAPPMIKVLWSGEKPPYTGDIPPGTIYLYRDYAVENQHRHLLRTDPEELARLHVEASVKASAYLAQNGFPKARQLFESMNEPAVWASETVARLARYLVAFLNGLHAHGLHGVVGNLGVGWPNNSGPDTPPVWTWFQPVANAMQPGDYLGAHEYWHNAGPQENWGWWAGRVLKCPYNVPILITECGIDGGVKEMGNTDSWMNIWPGVSLDDAARRFTDELWEYMERMRQDPRIQGIFPYTYDYATDQEGHSKWGFFDQRPAALKQAILRKRAAVSIPAPQPFSWGAAPAPTPTPTPVPVTGRARGIDISYYQNEPVNWSRLKAEGYSFAFLRASVGYSMDAELFRHWNQSASSKIVRGLYHYLHGSYPGRQQARFFYSLWSHLGPTLPGAVDVESESLTPATVKDFVERWKELSGEWPIIYTSKSKWERIVGKKATWARDCPLWVAHYGVDKPDLPDVWKEWTFWQYGQAQTGAYPKKIDHNVFAGTEIDLLVWMVQESTTPPVVPEEPTSPTTYTIRPTYSETGNAYVIGNFPEVGIEFILTDPYGNRQQAWSGSKQEYGRGGFLFNTYTTGTHTLEAPGVGFWSFTVRAGQTVWLAFDIN